jgi:hypothetical protein
VRNQSTLSLRLEICCDFEGGEKIKGILPHIPDTLDMRPNLLVDKTAE